MCLLWWPAGEDDDGRWDGRGSGSDNPAAGCPSSTAPRCRPDEMRTEVAVLRDEYRQQVTEAREQLGVTLGELASRLEASHAGSGGE
jgi:hypothetical protein